MSGAEQATVTKVLLPFPRFPTFALPILQASPQSNAQYIQVLDLRGRVTSLEPCIPQDDACAAAPAPRRTVAVGDAALRALVDPDGEVLVGARSELAPGILGWLDRIEHPTTRLAFAQFAGDDVEVRRAAQESLDLVAGQIGRDGARRWFIDAVVRPKVFRALFRAAPRNANVERVEQLVAQADLQIVDRELVVIVPAAFETEFGIVPSRTSDGFAGVLAAAGPLGVASIEVSRRRFNGAVERVRGDKSPPGSYTVIVVGHRAIFAASCKPTSSIWQPATDFSIGDKGVEVRQRPDGSRVVYAPSTEELMEHLDEVFDRSLPGLFRHSVLFVVGEEEGNLRQLGVAAHQLRERFPSKEMVASIGLVFAGVKRIQRESEHRLSQSGDWDSILSFANAWTPTSVVSGTPGGVERLVQSIDGWLHAARAGVLPVKGDSRRSKRSPIISTASIAKPSGQKSSADMVRALANPLWPGRGERLVFGASGRDLGDGHPTLRLAPHDLPLRDPPYAEIYTTDPPNGAPRRQKRPAFAMAVVTQHDDEGGFVDYVRHILIDLGWEVNGGPNADLVVRNREGLKSEIDVKMRPPPEGDRRAQDITVVGESLSGTGRHGSNLVGFNALRQLRQILRARAESTAERPDVIDQINRIQANVGIAMSGGPAARNEIVPVSLAQKWIAADRHIVGNILFPMISGRDVARYPEGRWLSHFGDLKPAEAAAVGDPYRFAVANRDAQLDSPSGLPRLPRRIVDLGREDGFLLTAALSKYRIFVRCRGPLAPTSSVVVIIEDQPWLLALLSSRVHAVWAEAVGRWRSNTVRYSVRSFETFPIPKSLAEGSDGALHDLLSRLGSELSSRRAAWQFEGQESVGGVLDSDLLTRLTLDHREDLNGAHGRARALTHLYDDPPAWLSRLSDRLNRAVLEAYDLPFEAGSEQIIQRLIALNAQATGRSLAQP